MSLSFLKNVMIICVFSIASSVVSQERTLTGVVTTLENIVVVNAEVKVLSNKATVLTDSLGKFKINCLPNDKLKISARGFYTQKIKIDEQNEEIQIDLIFKPGEKNINVAMGFGHIKEKDKSYAISNIRNTSKNDFSKYSNMIDLIVNSSPSIVLSGGQIVIRGTSSLNGSSAALIIVDGIDVIMSQLSTISPQNVKSVDILKGGAAAIYGSRGANGVVLITTKRGGDQLKD